MKQAFLILAIVCMALSASAEFRTWTDRKGNSLEAEFVRKDGLKIILRDRKGKIHRVDPLKLSKEDRLYLNPPPPEPPKYKLTLHKSTQQGKVIEDDETGAITVPMKYEFAMQVEFLVEDARVDGLKGALFIVGQDQNGHFVGMDKIEGPLEMSGEDGVRLQSTGFELEIQEDDDHKLVEGVRYWGFLMVLYAADGSVLGKEYSNAFLADHEKVFALQVGDRFSKKLKRID